MSLTKNSQNSAQQVPHKTSGLISSKRTELETQIKTLRDEKQKIDLKIAELSRELSRMQVNTGGGNNKDITVELYYALWCPHCVKMLPEFEKLKKHYKDDDSVSIKGFEDGDSKTDPECEAALAYKKMAESGNEIKGFPTMFINGTKYTGPMTAEALISYIEEQKKEVNDEKHDETELKKISMLGGAHFDPFHRKYLKYKAKYLGLKLK